RRQQAHQSAQGHALARARLAQDAEHRSGLEVEAHPVDGGHDGIAHDEAHMQILDRYDRLLCRFRLRHRLTAAAARLWPEPGTRMWQATARDTSPGGASMAGGTLSHTPSAKGQRVRKRHPEGGLIGLGGSPLSGALSVRRRGSIDGMADSTACVWGGCGARK